jgi:hypothetical protein
MKSVLQTERDGYNAAVKNRRWVSNDSDADRLRPVYFFEKVDFAIESSYQDR